MSTSAPITLAFPRERRLVSNTLARIQLTFCAQHFFFPVGCCASKLMILTKDHVSSSWRDIYTFRIAFGAFCENFHIGNQLKLSLLVNRPDGIRSVAIKKYFYVPRSKDTRRESRKKSVARFCLAVIIDSASSASNTISFELFFARIFKHG